MTGLTCLDNSQDNLFGEKKTCVWLCVHRTDNRCDDGSFSDVVICYLTEYLFCSCTCHLLRTLPGPSTSDPLEAAPPDKLRSQLRGFSDVWLLNQLCALADETGLSRVLHRLLFGVCVCLCMHVYASVLCLCLTESKRQA